MFGSVNPAPAARAPRTSPAPRLAVVVAASAARARAQLRVAFEHHADLEIVAEACTRWDAGEVLRELQPDAAVVEIGLLSTTEFFLHGWGSVWRCTQIVAVGPDDPALASRLGAMGAAAYVPCDRVTDELCDAVRGACARRPSHEVRVRRSGGTAGTRR
jgi:DNA-binding NarL/FixJ family response regulator